MVDPRFFKFKGQLSLADILTLTGARVAQSSADSAQKFSGVAPLDIAGADDVSFLENKKYEYLLQDSKAGACLVDEASASKQLPSSTILLIHPKPRRAFGILAQAMYEESTHSWQNIAPSAVVHPAAVLGQNVTVAPMAVIDAGAKIGAGTYIGPKAVIGASVEIGENCRIDAGVVISHAVIGKDVHIKPNACIGQRGFGFDPSPEGHLKMPQLGIVIIEDGAEIGAGTCVDRGAGPNTIIRRGAMIDNLVQIGHNVEIGAGSVIASQTGISGSTKIGRFVTLAGQVGLAGHLEIGDGATIAAKSGIAQNVEAGQIMGGYPALPIRLWHRQTAWLKKAINKKSDENK